MDHLAVHLRALGVDAVSYTTRGAMADEEVFQDYDIVHFGYLLGVGDEGIEWINTIIPPITGNVWHVPPERQQAYAATLFAINAQRIFVDDTTTLQLLGQMGFTEVAMVPLAFDPTIKFHHLPPPVGPFTVGAFGDSYPHKRFPVIREACKIAGVEFYDAVHDYRQREGVFETLDPVADVYAHIHTLAHASFNDTNSLPAEEALACGRPVLSTISYGMTRVLQDGVNGYFYDGSARDLARKIVTMRERYEVMAGGARATVFPDPRAAAQVYLDTFNTILEEAPPDDTPDQRLQSLLIS
jgi:hypothetical protein